MYIKKKEMQELGKISNLLSANKIEVQKYLISKSNKKGTLTTIENPIHTKITKSDESRLTGANSKVYTCTDLVLE